MARHKKSDAETSDAHPNQTELRGSWLHNDEMAELDAVWKGTPYGSRASYVEALVREHIELMRTGETLPPGFRKFVSKRPIYGSDIDPFLDLIAARIEERKEKKPTGSNS